MGDEVAAGIDIDESRYPLLVITFYGDVSDDAFRAYLDRLEAMMHRRAERGEKAALVFDATHSGTTPPSQRRIQADWLNRHRALIQQTSVGSAFVVPNALVRGFLTAVMWLSPMPTVHEVCGRPDDAVAWCEDRLREADIPLASARPTAK